MWVCKHCESVNSDKDHICIVCDQYKDTNYNEKKEETKMKKFKSFIACVASLCIMSTFAFSVAAAEGDQTVNELYYKMSKDSDWMLEIVTSYSE